MRPAKLWRSMPPDVRAAAARAFWTDENAALEQAEAIALIARQIKFRPRSVQALPVDKRAKYLAGIAQVSDLLAARLLVVYHLEFQRPMMGAFLDALGIKHDQGLIEEDTPEGADARGAGHGRRHAGGGLSEGRRRPLLLDPALAGPRHLGRAPGPARAGRARLMPPVRAPRLRLRQPPRGRASARLLQPDRRRGAAQGLQAGARRARPAAAGPRQPLRLPRSVRARPDRGRLSRGGLVRRRHR